MHPQVLHLNMSDIANPSVVDHAQGGNGLNVDDCLHAQLKMKK